MEPAKTFVLHEGLDFTVCILAHDNGDGVMYHQLEVSHASDTGSVVSMVLPFEGDFDPDTCGKNMIAAQLNKP